MVVKFRKKEPVEKCPHCGTQHVEPGHDCRDPHFSDPPGFVLKDSGKRTEFATGAVRDDGGDKPRPDLIPASALMRVGRWYGMGAEKYGEHNWTKGIPMSRCYAAAFRHLLKWALCWRDEDHLAAVAFNVFALIHYEETGRADLDDMPRYDAPKAA